MQPFAERLSLFAFKFDEPMGDVIFIQEIIELMSFACAACRENAQPSKFPIASDPSPTHDECVDDRGAYAGQFGERAPQFSCGHVKYLRFRRGHAGAG